MINVDLIETVVFDLGRVLVKIDFTQGLFRYYQSDDNSTDEELLEILYRDPVFIDFNTGKIDSQQLYRTLTEKYSLPLSYPEFTYEWCNIFSPMRGMESVVERVCKKFKCGLLSDIDPLHWQYCQAHFPVLKHFKNPALSFEIGALKPDLKCYQHAARNTDTDLQRCLFIDDREVNIHGAQHAGMQAIHFTGAEDLDSLLRSFDI